MPRLKVKNLTKSYGVTRAVDHIDFEVKEGEFFTILGPSGAGKTTILELIAGIKPMDEGRIYFDGEDVSELFPQERDIAMAFENYSLYPHMSVYENIMFPLNAPGRVDQFSKEEKNRMVREIAKVLGIENLLDRQPQHLSGGQKQRSSLARAMVRRPKFYLLDEPIAHLDAKLKVSARTTLKKLAATLGTTIIYVTHDWKEALALSDRIMILRKGKIVQIDEPDVIYTDPKDDFVARLVGEPPINLLDGDLFDDEGESRYIYDDNIHFPLSGEVLEKAHGLAWKENEKLKVRMGIRPDYVNVAKEKIGASPFKLPVYAVEHETDRSIVTFELKDTFFLASTDSKVNWKIGDEVWVDFNPTAAYFFEKTIEIQENNRN